MKTVTGLKRVSLIMLIVNLSACQDHFTEPQRPRFRIKQTLYDSRFTYGDKVYGSYSTVVYTYDNAGRVSSYVTYPEAVANPASEGKLVTQLQYDQQGRLSLIDTPRGGNYGTSERVTYEYDATGKLYLVKEYSQFDPDTDFLLTRKDSLAYDANVLTQWTFYPRASTGVVIANRITFTNGNATRVGNTAFTYDDKPNPFYGYIFPRLDIVGQFSRNNVILDNQRLFYDSNGLLIRKVESATYTYTYEAY